jgi:hypothetical protein
MPSSYALDKAKGVLYRAGFGSDHPIGILIAEVIDEVRETALAVTEKKGKKGGSSEK